MIIKANGKTYIDGTHEINPPELTDYQKNALKEFCDHLKKNGETYYESANDSLVSAREYGRANGAAQGLLTALHLLGIKCEINDAGDLVI